MASWFSSLLGGPSLNASTRDPSDDFWYKPIPYRNAAGTEVTLERAMKVPVVAACLRVLSESVGQLPCKIIERKAGGEKDAAENHPLFDVVHQAPNSETTAFEFWGQCVWDLASEGNFYAEIIAGSRGPVSELVRFEPKAVTVERLRDGTVRYKVRMDDGTERVFLQGEIWHLKALPLAQNGLVGTSPLELAKEAVAASIAVQEFGSRFFANDCTPPYVIKHPGNFKDKESKKNFLRAIKRWWGGENKGSPAVLEYGMEMNKLGNTNEESQFLETRKENAYDIARIYRMPPHKVGLLDKATFSNIEQQSLEFVIDTLLPWLRLIEQGIARDLLIAPQRYFAEFNVAGLLRGDLKARYESYFRGRMGGWLSVNDIRKLENMNGIGDDGDRYLEPRNMWPPDEAAEGNAGDQAPPPTGRELNGHNIGSNLQ